MGRASVTERLFAAAYPRLSARTDGAGLAALRARLLAAAVGETLEVGAGHGANLRWYPDAVRGLTLAEPSAPMRARLIPAAAARRPNARIVDTGVESLPFGDGALDTVVCTLVLCSVPDPAAGLAEIARVLAPGGRLLFCEHVRADPAAQPWLACAQSLLAAPHAAVSAGCRPDRRTEALLRAVPGLRVTGLERSNQPSALPLVRPIVWGSAVRVGR